MEPSRTTREQRSGLRDDDTGTGGQWDDSISKGNQGKWEHREDNTGSQGVDTYTPQHLGQSGYDEYGTSTVGAGTGPGPTQSDRYATSGQYDGPIGQTTAGYTDPNRNITGSGRRLDNDDDYSAGMGNTASGVGKPSITNRVKGAAEKMTGKIMGDPGKQARGQERQEGTF